MVINLGSWIASTLAGLLWTTAALLVAQFLFVQWNLRQLPRIGATGEVVDGSKRFVPPDHPTTHPDISVLIPARDEAHHIGDCVSSILRASADGVDATPTIEIIVLDDGSVDGTATVAQSAACNDARVRIVQGRAKPDGWLGKSYACAQLAEMARGRWLLFFDADTRLLPGALDALLRTAETQRSGLVTGFPHQQVGSWAEKLIVPLMMFTIACHLPIRLVRHSRDPRFVAAHGALMFIHKGSYRAIGGHATFKESLLDDMEMARAVKRAGLPVTLAHVSPFVTMRMYNDSQGVWNGYKKNIFAGLGRSSLLLTVVFVSYSCLYVLPPVAIISAGFLSIPSAILWPATISWLLGVAIKFKVDENAGQPGRYSWLLAPGIVLLLGIMLASWWASVTGKGYEWKGRRYL